jgi:hypothetical protein
VVPLSDHEQRLLDQIERALYAEDPKFASQVRRADLRTLNRRRMWRAAVVFVVGFGLMLFGVAEPLVGIAGFVVMLLALALALSAWKKMSGNPAALRAVDGRAERRAPAKKKAHGSARQRLEERWQRRWDDRGR